MTDRERIERVAAELARLRTEVRNIKTVSLRSAVDALGLDVAGLQGEVIALQGDVSTLQSGVSTLQGDVSTLQGAVSTLQSDVSTLQSNVSTLQSDVSTLESQVADLLIPAYVIGRNSSTSQVSIGTSSTNIISVVLNIPGEWNSYDVEAYSSCLLLDTSGGATSAGTVVTAQMVHPGGNFNEALPHEVMDLNYHDNNAFSQVSWVQGLTPTGNQTFTWQMARTSTFTVAADQITLIVKAYRVS